LPLNKREGTHSLKVVFAGPGSEFIPLVLKQIAAHTPLGARAVDAVRLGEEEISLGSVWLHDLGVGIRDSGSCDMTGCSRGPASKNAMQLVFRWADAVIYLTKPGTSDRLHPQAWDRLLEIAAADGLDLRAIPSETWWIGEPGASTEPGPEGPGVLVHQSLGDPDGLVRGLRRVCEMVVESLEQSRGKP